MNQHTSRLMRQKPRQRLSAPTAPTPAPLPETASLAILVRLLGRAHWRQLSALFAGKLEGAR